ncbi:MAG TPA: VanZ family protein [Candidatus Moranbacteria bacterium]|nr:VanZ family protein [Candidatus Moranbacteria bacterium]
MKNKPFIFLKYHLPAVLWAGVIFYFSNVPDLKVGAESIRWEIIWRKAAHTGEYAVLFWLLWRLFYYGYRKTLKKSLAISLIVVFLYSISDEYHQTLTFGRTGKIIDVIFDLLSAFLTLQLIIFYKEDKARKKIIVPIFITLMLIVNMEYEMIRESEGGDGEKIETNVKKDYFFEEKTEPPKAEEKKEEDIFFVEDEKKEEALPLKIKINVPFTTQAPFANWDEYHEESCEEASIIMIKYYLDGKSLNKEIAEKEIQSMIKFQIKNYGDYKDTSAKESEKLAKDFYGIANLKVVYDFKKEDIKKYLAQKKPIIVPAAGRLLGNPNFTPPGPLYHNLVLVGYEGDMIITNDPGTRKGEGYRYDIDTFYEAIHDFPGNPVNIEKGRKAMIVLE